MEVRVRPLRRSPTPDPGLGPDLRVGRGLGPWRGWCCPRRQVRCRYCHQQAPQAQGSVLELVRAVLVRGEAWEDDPGEVQLLGRAVGRPRRVPLAAATPVAARDARQCHLQPPPSPQSRPGAKKIGRGSVGSSSGRSADEDGVPCGWKVVHARAVEFQILTRVVAEARAVSSMSAPAPCQALQLTAASAARSWTETAKTGAASSMDTIPDKKGRTSAPHA